MLSSGARLGPYEVLSPLGAGGMGEVYRARDTKLGRDVALKVLPEAFTSDPDRLARFEREAKVLASLNHPHIAQIYGLEEADGQKALVLELVEGPTLADRIAQGPIPLDEALAVAKQIAEALEAAHEQGIIHRDLKPANVKVKPDGTVKVLDFGLAKAFEPEGVDPNASHSPTLTARATQLGVILGTAAYMSPEQARGKPVDKRADIWAFGVVLYEMLTGRRPFVGEDVSLTLAEVMKSEPDWSRLPGETPRPIRRLVRRCLEKSPERRLRDIGDVRLELEELQAGALDASGADSQVGVVGAADRTPRPRIAALFLWASGVAFAGAALGFVLGRGSERGQSSLPPADQVATSIDLPAESPLAPVPRIGIDSPKVAISPDGRRLVYVGEAKDGTALFLRDMDRYEVQEIPGTKDAVYAFFSPDGLWVGFLTNDKLKKVSLSGDPPIALADVQGALRAVWTRINRIYVAEAAGTLLSRVPSEGGAKETLVDLIERFPGSRWAGFSDVMPDGSAALVVVWSRSQSADHADVHLLSLDANEARPLLQFGYDARFAGEDHIVFARGGSLFAVAWNRALAAVSGEAHLVASAVRMETHIGQAQYSVSESGTLVSVPGGVQSVTRVTRVDRSGRAELLDAPAQTYSAVSVAPDGRRLALGVADVSDYVWIYDLERKEGRKLTAGAVPVWSPDGQNIAFSTVNSQGRWQLVAQAVEGTSSSSRVLYSSEAQVFASSWSPDGRTLGLYQQGAGIYFTGFVDVGATGAAPAIPNPGEYSLFPRFSPDGHWVAYTSAISGRFEVWVRSHPDGQTIRQVSTDGGIEPVWCANGELFYRTGNRWMVTSVRTSPDLSWDPPRSLFTVDFVDTPNGTWDVAPDGKYIFLFQSASENVRTRLHVVSNVLDAREGAR